MLFALAEFEHGADELFGRIVARHREPSDSLRVGRCVLGAWSSSAVARVDAARNAVVEGWIEFGEPSVALSAASLCEARGDFALIAHTEEGLLVASGAAGGCRPVYVAYRVNGAVASTHLECVLDALPERPKVDVDFLAAVVSQEAWARPAATPYIGVQRVPGGEAWTLGTGAIRRDRIVRPLRETQIRGTDADLAAQLREELSDSIERALQGRRRVALAVSGGLDSSSITALTCRLARAGKLDAPPELYHFDFDSPSAGDDRPYVQALAAHLEVKPLHVTPADAGAFRRLMTIDAMPCRAGGPAYWTALGRRARERGADLLLTGEGGDFVLNGTPSLLADLAWHGRPLQALRKAIRLRDHTVSTALSRARHYVLQPLAGRWFPDRLRRIRRRSAFRRDYPWAGPRLHRHLRAVADAYPPRPSLDWSPAERYEALLAMPLFEEFVIARAQEGTVAGNTRRDPFLDDDFLRFVARLPPLSLMHGDLRRGLLREAMRGLLPERVRLRRTKGYFDPALLQMVEAAGGFSLLEDLSDVRLAADLGLVEPAWFRRHFEEFRRKPLEFGWPVTWSILAIESFLRHLEQTGGA